MATDWQAKFKAVAVEKGIPVPEQSGPDAKIVDGEVCDEPITDADIDVAVEKYGGELNIKLRDGGILRVTKSPAPAMDAVEITAADLKTMIGIANKFNGKIVRVMTKAQSEKYEKEERKGFWVGEHIYVEMDRDKLSESRPTSAALEILGEATEPESKPPLFPNMWMKISGTDILKTSPVRIGKRVIGSINQTKNGFLYTMTADIQKIGKWPSGVFVLDNGIFKETIYPNKAIVMIRCTKLMDKLSFFTTAEWIQTHGGFVRMYGHDKIVMPAYGNYWTVVKEDGSLYTEE